MMSRLVTYLCKLMSLAEPVGPGYKNNKSTVFAILSFSLFAIFGLNDYEKSKLEVFIYKFKRKK